jgi:hypothetical protein
MCLEFYKFVDRIIRLNQFQIRYVAQLLELQLTEKMQASLKQTDSEKILRSCDKLPKASFRLLVFQTNLESIGAIKQYSRWFYF